MSNLTLLTEEQCFGQDKLEIFEKRGIKSAITDFAILLGGWVSNDHISNDNSLEGRTGSYWTKTLTELEDIRVVNDDGDKRDYSACKREIGTRLALPLSSLANIPTNETSGRRADDMILEVEYGFYPQRAVSAEMQKTLNDAELYLNEGLTKTKNSYTTDSTNYSEEEQEFEPQVYQEYEYYGKKYVKVIAKSCFDGYNFMLSNGEKYKDGDSVWIEVEPIKWLVDEKTCMMITDKIIFAGVQFDEKENDISYDFNKTNMKKFIDEYFSKDLAQEIKQEMELNNNIPTRKSRLEKLNPDEMNNNRTKMTDTEIIQNWIESGESVLLRGPSGIGKTERIKTLYPDLIYMKLTNNMFPEKVVGSVNLQTGQSIPPNFAKTAIMQEATEEERKLIEENIQNIYDIADTVYERSKTSDKKVVIMLDELLNVKPAVQSLVYTLVLNRIVEIGKGLKLPDNVVIVATGNQKKYSVVAEDLAEPLEKRFNHILDMEPKVGEWITEYAIPKKIHPAVIGYMLTNYNETGKSENIEDIAYFYEEPEIGEKHLDANGCKGRTNDPRGWASISNTLYNFEKNLKAGKYKGKDIEDIMKRSISSKLRNEWATEFFDFYNLPTISPEEIVEGMGKGYTKVDLPRNISERFAYMTALITADESQVEACRKFIREHCDSEYLSIYDIYWAGNDERKMEKISELQEMDIDLYNGKEAQEYANEGVPAYTDIGQMYSSYLTKDKEVRGEEYERS